jgi:hypothetical protein
MAPQILDGIELARKLREPYEHVMRLGREGAIPTIKIGNRVYLNLGAVVRTIRERQAAEQGQAEAPR